MVVTPSEVKDKVDYESLINEFGTQPSHPNLRKSKQTQTNATSNSTEKSFNHDDLDIVLDFYEKGTTFVLYTGKGPSP